ncbi:Uncharacterised protein [Mycobacteroides abscessus subsp. abscessus]|nr:Uncharacterised protein [Mycobacteroides abscessus subsp. abscessus]
MLVRSQPSAFGSTLWPGFPKRCGMTAVQPISATFRAKSATLGLIPGISAMTITAGPLPFRNTILVSPS